MILPYYNCVTGETELREPPHDSDETARMFIPQDDKCQAEYSRLRNSGKSISDTFFDVCLYAVKHHGWMGDKDSEHID